MKKTAIILIALLLCIAMSSLGLGKVKTAVPKPSKSGVDTVASATPSYYRTFTESYLKTLPLTGGYYSCLKAKTPFTFWWQDWYGVSLANLLNEEVGLMAGSTGVRLYAADGWSVDYTMDMVMNLNSQGLPFILAWQKGADTVAPNPSPPHQDPPLPAITDPTEGPFRSLYGQQPNVGPYNVADPASGGTPNFQNSLKTVRAVEVQPLPSGTTPVNVATIPADQVIVYGNIQPYRIENVETTSTDTGTEVTVNGWGFFGTQGSSFVSFGTTQATVYNSWGTKRIKCMVPTGVTGTVNVTVTTSEGTSNEVPITIQAPAITSLNPAAGLVGTDVTVAGSCFGTHQGTATVSFGGTQATASSWSDGEIKCKVPAGVTGIVDVTVTTSEGTSNAIPFSVTLSAPTVTSVTPSQSVNYNTVNMKVAGTGFQAGATVRMVKGATIISPTKTVVTDTLITCTFKLNYASLGKYDVIVKNPDAQEGKWAKQFAVTNLCGASAAISVLGLGLVMGLLSIGGLTRRRRHRKD